MQFWPENPTGSFESFQNYFSALPGMTHILIGIKK